MENESFRTRKTFLFSFLFCQCQRTYQVCNLKEFILPREDFSYFKISKFRC